MTYFRNVFFPCDTLKRYDNKSNKKLCFYGRIRTLVVMATYSFIRRIMGKVEIDKNYSC